MVIVVCATGNARIYVVFTHGFGFAVVHRVGVGA